MFEYHYSVQLTFVHPSIDPAIISERIVEFEPDHTARAGHQSLRKDGTPIGPEGLKATLSVWRKKLHEEDRIYSGDLELTDFIVGKLNMLQQYADIIHEIGKEGEVYLSVDWFCESNSSASILKPEMLKKCGEIGLGIELNIYNYVPP